ncbi:hypothetical protein [Mycolicibacterium moriokaense]|uniref:Secreted protein n=1 Tax=Mycolicibacterium moriokaense TaxID=39691 RepID=A0A318H8S4_9MYCO|nr:hypothetical protein [Mycolicibacterium moriokaense]PXW94508.1 hypothetical protein C8E89_1671 [Mycolicibacterium moriokaense]
MRKYQASSKGSFTVGKLAGTVVAAGAVLFAAPAAMAFADPLGDLGHAVNQTVNQVNTVVQGNVNGANGILQGNVNGANGILQGNVGGGNGILQGNVNNTNNILRGLLGLH